MAKASAFPETTASRSAHRELPGGRRARFAPRELSAMETMHVDAAIAREVAAAFDATPSTRQDALVAAAYASLERQTDRLFAEITRPGNPSRVHVVFTSGPTPYANDQELINAVRSDGVLEVRTAATEPDRRHPMLDCERGGAYDRFRAVHDILGHVRLGCGFDPDGEYTTWRFQERRYRGLARWALATELHAEHSVLWTTGQLAEHKAILLSRALLARARRGLQPTQQVRKASPSPPSTTSSEASGIYVDIVSAELLTRRTNEGLIPAACSRPGEA